MNYCVRLKIETEIKLRLAGKLGAVRRRLQKAGLHVTKPRVKESNCLFDTAKCTLRKQGKLIRVRVTNGKTILTYKGPSQTSKYKQRPELEIELRDGNRIEEIFEQMGYRPVFRYEKFRTEYSNSPASGKVLLDETPIGNFLEIEGSPRWIDRIAKLLGFSPHDYITHSYGHLYLAYCRERRIRPTDMVFQNRRAKKQ